MKPRCLEADTNGRVGRKTNAIFRAGARHRAGHYILRRASACMPLAMGLKMGMLPTFACAALGDRRERHIYILIERGRRRHAAAMMIFSTSATQRIRTICFGARRR